ncbi:MAG: imidazole glycerol phosphate synthase subunit HisH [Bacteroidota bacterium]|jgi:glutamine amidotransferase|nr:imidazole glycerol phosphate synthase subunit HisH [Sphingobacteriales bacterium]
MSQSPTIVIIDYGVGNTYSVINAILRLGYTKVKVSDKEADIKSADALILPGVGAFDEAVRNLKSHHLPEVLNETVLIQKKPILGICVGMQLLAEGSEENGWHEGLNWIPGKVKKLELPPSYAVPQVGWNNISFNNRDPLFSRTAESPNFYFDHSYHFETKPEHRLAWCDYGIEVTAAVQKDNIFGVQFHPEKSQTNGLKLFRGFFNSI